MIEEWFPFIWLGLAILLAIVEAATLGLTTIWFALGALLGLLSSVLGLSPILQFLVFLVSSILLLIFTRPIAKNYLKIGAEKTNVDSLLNSEGVVTKKINKFETGLVKVKGQIWTAISEDGEEIEENNIVTIIKIEGVKLIVTVKK